MLAPRCHCLMRARVAARLQKTYLKHEPDIPELQNSISADIEVEILQIERLRIEKIQAGKCKAQQLLRHRRAAERLEEGRHGGLSRYRSALRPPEAAR